MKNKKIIFIFTIILVFLFKLNSVMAYEFIAHFFPGNGGYLQYDGRAVYQEAKPINTEKAVVLSNYYVHGDGYQFVGWIAEYDKGAKWYCKDGSEAANCGNGEDYKLYSSVNERTIETGKSGGHAGFHAVWKKGNDFIYPDELGNPYDYYDVQYLDADGNYIGGQSMIIGQKNKLMIYDNENDDRWNAGILKKDLIDWEAVLNKDLTYGFASFEKVRWYCNDDIQSNNCRVKKIYASQSVETGADGDMVFFQVYKENYKKQYYILYLSRNDNQQIDDRALIKAEYDTNVRLNSKIFHKDGKVIDKWLIYSYDRENNYNQICYNQYIDTGEDFIKHFSTDYCKDTKKIEVESDYEISIPYNSNFRITRFGSFSDGGRAGYHDWFSYVIIAEAVWKSGDDGTGYSPYNRCVQKRKVWVQTGDTEDAGFCSIDGNLYLKCGDDAKDIPEFVPRLASYAVTLLKTAAPIVLIIVSLVYLVKSMTSGKEDEIKKERTNFIKKLIIAAIIYFVVTIVQFIVLKVADSSEKKSLTNCLSCFLNGTGDNNCSNLYYKDNENGDIVCKWLSNNKEFDCEK